MIFYPQKGYFSYALLSDTGLRLAEGAGILTQDLHLNAEIPFLRVKDHHWRRLKTSGSTRDVPLVGMSLWAAKRIKNNQPNESFAFPRYNKGELTNANSASASLNKWLKPYVPYGCTLHSLRHREQNNTPTAPRVLRKILIVFYKF
jgi:hypothetical protein